MNRPKAASQSSVKGGSGYRYRWSKLNRMQKGTFGEYFVKMEFTMYGFQVYGTEVDDRGIDFVARHDRGDFYEVQVKTVTDRNLQFIYEEKFRVSSEYLVALVCLSEGREPKIYLFQGTDWPSKDGLLVYAAYENKKSKPAYEIRLAKSREAALAEYEFGKKVLCLTSGG